MLNASTNKLLTIENFSDFLNSLTCIKNASTIAVAVSSGVDSMSLLHISNIWAKKYKKKLYVISYNHNLRKESLIEVKYVKTISKKLGWEHKTLKWSQPAKKNILENARIARYQAISNFCKRQNINTLLLGHHLDDLIETFCIRLLKNSRLDGLCPMTASRKLFNLNLIRPFLQTSKQEMYSYAKLNKIRFFEDPTNKNSNYIRTKIRFLLEKNKNLKYKFSKSVDLFCRLKKYSDNITNKFNLDNIKFEKEGYFLINRINFLKLPEFLNIKILNIIIMNLGNNTYPLRSRTLLRLSKTILEEKLSTTSAGGCLLINQKTHIFILREFNHIKDLKLSISQGKKAIWDKKFLITNLSRNYNIYVTSFGKELENKSFLEFYNTKKSIVKKMPFVIKKTLPVIKTLEGLIYIPHLNIYNNKNIKKLVSLEIIDYYNIYN